MYRPVRERSRVGGLTKLLIRTRPRTLVPRALHTHGDPLQVMRELGVIGRRVGHAGKPPRQMVIFRQAGQ